MDTQGADRRAALAVCASTRAPDRASDSRVTRNPIVMALARPAAAPSRRLRVARSRLGTCFELQERHQWRHCGSEPLRARSSASVRRPPQGGLRSSDEAPRGGPCGSWCARGLYGAPSQSCLYGGPITAVGRRPGYTSRRTCLCRRRLVRRRAPHVAGAGDPGSSERVGG